MILKINLIEPLYFAIRHFQLYYVVKLKENWLYDTHFSIDIVYDNYGKLNSFLKLVRALIT